MANTLSAHAEGIGIGERAVSARPAYYAFRTLQVAFVLAPLLAGIDKFLHWMVNWDMYLAPWVANILPFSGHTFMLLVGCVEIIAAFIVLLKPKVGAWIVAAWLWGIIINLLSSPGFYDVALRDFGLSLGAVSLALLSREFSS